MDASYWSKMSYSSSASMSSSGLSMLPFQTEARSFQTIPDKQSEASEAGRRCRWPGTQAWARVKVVQLRFSLASAADAGCREDRPGRVGEGRSALGVPDSSLDKKTWGQLLEAYDPDDTGEVVVEEIVAATVQPVAAELIGCLVRTVTRLSLQLDALTAESTIERSRRSTQARRRDAARASLHGRAPILRRLGRCDQGDPRAAPACSTKRCRADLGLLAQLRDHEEEPRARRR